MTQSGEQYPIAADQKHRLELVLDIIRAATRKEDQAHGPERRTAFRITRHLIGGATRLGISPTLIANALGVGVDCVRTRGTIDGIVAPDIFAELADVPATALQMWLSTDQLELSGPDPAGTSGYRASELLNTLVRRPPVGSLESPPDTPALFKTVHAETAPTRYKAAGDVSRPAQRA